MALIDVEHYSYTYHDGHRALKDISFSITEGEHVALIGANGAGKSTLLKAFVGLLSGEGKISIAGMPVVPKNFLAIRKILGIVMQDPEDQLFCPTVLDEVSFGPLNLGRSPEEATSDALQALAMVGLEHSGFRSAHHMSLGEKRRVAIASVLSMQPKLLALDEPTAMLDPKRRRWLLQFIASHLTTTVTATHDLAFALECCKRTIIMHRGAIVADGESSLLLSDTALLERYELA